jgi:hypothetical protein
MPLEIFYISSLNDLDTLVRSKLTYLDLLEERKTEIGAELS